MKREYKLMKAVIYVRISGGNRKVVLKQLEEC